MTVYVNEKVPLRRGLSEAHFDAVKRMYELKPDETYLGDTFDLIDLNDEEKTSDDYTKQIDEHLYQIAKHLAEITELADKVPEKVSMSVYRRSNFEGGYLNSLCIAAAASAYHYWQNSCNDNMNVSFDSNYHLNQVLANMIECAYHYWHKDQPYDSDDVLSTLLRMSPFYSNKSNSEFTIAAVAAYCSGFFGWHKFNEPKYDITKSRYGVVREVDGLRDMPHARCCFCGTADGTLVRARNHINYVLGFDGREKYEVSSLPLLQDVYICHDCAEQVVKQLSAI